MSEPPGQDNGRPAGEPGQAGSSYPQPYGQPPGYPPAGPGGPPAYYYPPAVPNHPKATLALVLGLVSVVGGFGLCGVPLLVSPFAWVIGHRVLNEIRASRGHLAGEGSAQAGMVLGIIGTVLLALWAVGVVLLVVVGLAADFGDLATPSGRSV